MADQDGDQNSLAKDRKAGTLAERVTAIQERARREGFVSDGSNDKPMMDEAWGEDYSDQELLHRIAAKVEEACLLAEGCQRLAAQSAR